MAKQIGGTKTTSTGRVARHIANPATPVLTRAVAGVQGKVVTGRVARHVGKPAPMRSNGR